MIFFLRRVFPFLIFGYFVTSIFFKAAINVLGGDLGKSLVGESTFWPNFILIVLGIWSIRHGNYLHKIDELDKDLVDFEKELIEAEKEFENIQDEK